MARKAHNIHYIYKTICNVTGRWYVGMHSTSNLEDGYMGSGKRLRHSIRKYGKDNHTKEILEYCNSREELVLREVEIVTKELILDDLCINLKVGGEGGFVSEEEKIKFIAYQREPTTRAAKSKRMIEHHKNGKIKYGISFLGKSHSEESKELMRKTMRGKGTGENNSQYGTCWITNDGVNKKIKKEDLESYLAEGWEKGRK